MLNPEYMIDRKTANGPENPHCLLTAVLSTFLHFVNAKRSWSWKAVSAVTKSDRAFWSHPPQKDGQSAFARKSCVISSQEIVMDMFQAQAVGTSVVMVTKTRRKMA